MPFSKCVVHLIYNIVDKFSRHIDMAITMSRCLENWSTASVVVCWLQMILLLFRMYTALLP